MSTDQESIIENIRRHADEIRVRVHLAGMDARDAWAALQPKLQKVEHMFDQATAAASDDMNELAATVQAELHKLRERVFADHPPTAK